MYCVLFEYTLVIVRSVWYSTTNTIIDNHIFKYLLSFTLFYIFSRLCNSNKYKVLLLYNITKRHGKWTINRQSIQNWSAVFDKSMPVRFSESPHIIWRLRFKSAYAPSTGEIGVYAMLLIWIINNFLSSSKAHKIEGVILYKIIIDRF